MCGLKRRTNEDCIAFFSTKGGLFSKKFLLFPLLCFCYAPWVAVWTLAYKVGHESQVRSWLAACDCVLQERVRAGLVGWLVGWRHTGGPPLLRCGDTACLCGVLGFLCVYNCDRQHDCECPACNSMFGVCSVEVRRDTRRKPQRNSLTCSLHSCGLWHCVFVVCDGVGLLLAAEL